MWPVNLRSTDAMDLLLYPSGPYPEREGESDCSFYLRTGRCRFGSTCRFNHPPNRNLALSAAGMNGEFPERIGQPECQYYLKTGSCKFGATCKFHHPKDKAGIAGKVPVNILGYPLRPNESDCAYYLRTGECKFGSTCKFHHPQPSTSLRVQQSLLTTSWPFSSIPSQCWQVPSSYTPLIVPQGILSWNPYMQGQVGSTEGQQKNEASYSSNVFSERLGQSECQYYMKTGDCKFGAVYQFHHPRERLMPAPDCILSPLGLPLRLGVPLCIFYSQYGICKFGPNCKFDHSMGIFAYNASAPSGVRRYVGSSSADVSLSETTAGNDNAKTGG